jgi:hypothetical protein
MYSRKRMEHFLKVLGLAFAGYIQVRLSLHLWGASNLVAVLPRGWQKLGL